MPPNRSAKTKPRRQARTPSFAKAIARSRREEASDSLHALVRRIQALDERISVLAEEVDVLKASWGWLEIRLEQRRTEGLGSYA